MLLSVAAIGSLADGQSVRCLSDACKARKASSCGESMEESCDGSCATVSRLERGLSDCALSATALDSCMRTLEAAMTKCSACLAGELATLGSPRPISRPLLSGRTQALNSELCLVAARQGQRLAQFVQPTGQTATPMWSSWMSELSGHLRNDCHRFDSYYAAGWSPTVWSWAEAVGDDAGNVRHYHWGSTLETHLREARWAQLTALRYGPLDRKTVQHVTTNGTMRMAYRQSQVQI
jgi:hypothetical protein